MRAEARKVAACIALALSGATAAHAAQLEASFTVAGRYDTAGRLLGKILPDADGAGPLRLLAERYTYSNGVLTSIEHGQLTSWPDETVAPAQWGGYGFAAFSTIEYTYDDYGRRETEQQRGADGTVTSLVQYGYNTQNLVQCRTVRMNPATYASPLPSACTPGTPGQDGPDRVTRFTYDDLDQVLTEQRAYDTGLQQTYLVNTYNGRQLRSQTDANINRTELEYDSFGRLFRRYYPSPTSRAQVNPSDYSEYTYEVNGNLRTERKRSGAIITYAYDRNNRLTDKTLSDRSYSDDVRYDYDLRGLTLATYFSANPEIGVFNGFDGFGRLETATSTMRTDTAAVVTRTLSYGYDADGNRTRVTHPDGVYFEYTYDGLNRVDGVLENDDATTLLTVAYRADGKRSGLLRPSGANTQYDFDNAGRLQSFMQGFNGTTDDLTNTFQYNPANQVTQLTRSNSLYSYAGSGGIAGNYKPNGLNQYTIVEGQRIRYDANGNLTSDGTLTYTYDMENRLAGTGGVAAGLRYDPLGRLVEIAVIPGTATHFLYDGDELVAEYTISGGTETRTRRYVHGDRTNEPWVQYNGSAVGEAHRRYLHLDHQGSVIAQSDQTAAVVARNAYDAFGVPRSTNSDRFGYTGQLWLSELELHYYRARMYSPRLGRFLQTDPIGYADDLNLYAYAGNDPLNKIDPTGMDSCETVNPDGSPGPPIPNCIGDPEGPETPIQEAIDVLHEIEVTASRIKKDKKTRSAINSDYGEVGFKTEQGQFTSVKLIPKCKKGDVEAYKFPPGFLTGNQSSAGHTHNQKQKSGIGPHDAAMALQTGMNIQADSTGTRGLAKLSTGSAIAFSANGEWGAEGADSTAQTVLDLANATVGGESNAASTQDPCT